MKINIVYFTSTGNTLWMCQKTKEMMEKRGHEVQYFDSVTCGPEYAAGYDLLGIYYPVWGSTMPDPLVRCIRSLEQGRGRKIFLIGNCAKATGDTGMHWKKILAKKGYDAFYVDHLYLPINSCFPGFSSWKAPGKEEQIAQFRKAEKELEKIVDAVLAGKRKVRGISLFSRWLGNFQRTFYNDRARFESWMPNFLVDMEACIRCRLCLRMCPVENIHYQKESDTFRFGPDCIYCLKCYNLCPKNAVLLGEASRDTEKYTRYKGPWEGMKPILYRD